MDNSYHYMKNLECTDILGDKVKENTQKRMKQPNTINTQVVY